MKKNKTLDKKTANDILQNVFMQCDVVPNSTPFDKLILRTMAETRVVSIFKYISIAFLILVLLTPLTFKRDPAFVIVEHSRNVSIENHALFDDFFVITLAGKDIDYGGIYAKKDDGAYIFPSSVDTSSGIVIFPYKGEALNIYIPSGDNDMIQAVLSQNKK